MSCCGQQRAALRSPARRNASPPVPVAPPLLRAPVALVHMASNATVVRGPSTGLVYLFGADGAALDVDARDAPALLAGGRFRASR